MVADGDSNPTDDAVAWPPFPDIAPNDPRIEFKKILYQAQTEAVAARYQAIQDAAKTQAAADTETSQAAWSNEYVLDQAVHSAYLDVAKAAIDRAQARAQFIQTAGAAVSTAYAAILALSYKADSTSPSGHPLAVQGVFATLFLGLAIALSAVYLAYLTKHDPVPGPAATPGLDEYQNRRLDAFIQWAAVPILSRVYFLHASVISLAIGVALLPLAYLPLSITMDIVVVFAAIVFVFVVPGLLVIRRP